MPQESETTFAVHINHDSQMIMERFHVSIIGPTANVQHTPDPDEPRYLGQRQLKVLLIAHVRP
jgi:hypothetical protein